MLNFKNNVRNRAGIWLFVLGSLLFTFGGADLTRADEHTSRSKIEDPYFLDFDTLRLLQARRGLKEELMCMEKKDPNTVWIAFPVMSYSSDYYSAIAGVVAAELHRRIDKNAVVPPTKFVIAKLEDGYDYKLMGYVYQEIPFAKPIQKARKQNGFNDYANHTIYKDHNIERSIATWKYLGMPMLPNSLYLAISEDNRLIRYDYSEAFQYDNLDVNKQCFYISDFSVSDYICDVGYIKILGQKLQEQHRTTLKTVIDDIRTAASQYLSEDGQKRLNGVLENILTNF